MRALIGIAPFSLHNFPNNAQSKQALLIRGRPSCCIRKQSTPSTRSSSSSSSLKTTWPSLSFSLFGSGFVLGPLIDGIHSRVELMVYQNGSTNIGPLHTNVWVNSRYQSTLMGAYQTDEVIQTFLNYQENIKRCVCIIYDPLKSNQGVLALKALKLSDSFMELYRSNDFTGEKLRETIFVGGYL